MPRGRHRQSQTLHRLLPSATVAVSAAGFAAAAWGTGDTLVLRALTAAAGCAACVGAVMSRRWDRAAGRRLADLTAARQRDEWRAEERAAELEADLEDSRELRGRLELKLRAKRAELARLRTEHADLLRRYATAESERARALEKRRRLAIEAATAAYGTEHATPEEPARAATPEAYAAAAAALRKLAERAPEAPAEAPAEVPAQHALPAAPERASLAAPGARPDLPVREHRLVPATAAAPVLPYPRAPRQQPAGRAQGGFDFFGTKKTPQLPAQPVRHAVEAGPAADAAPGDLADVVGDEAYAEHASGAEVIDLTAHDETEQLDVRELRARNSS
jgi:hypothetical protein